MQRYEFLTRTRRHDTLAQVVTNRAIRVRIADRSRKRMGRVEGSIRGYVSLDGTSRAVGPGMVMTLAMMTLVRMNMMRALSRGAFVIMERAEKQ